MFNENGNYNEYQDNRTFKEKFQDGMGRVKIAVTNTVTWAVNNPYLSVPLTIVLLNTFTRAADRRNIRFIEQEKNRRLEERLRYNREALRYNNKPTDEERYYE